MFDRYLIVDDSLRATDDGFAFDARLGYYRGLGLSMIEDLEVTIDGEEVPRDQIRFDEGPGPISLREMESDFNRRWGFGETATIAVIGRSPPAVGEHVLTLSERLRISYLPFPAINADTKTMAIA